MNLLVVTAGSDRGECAIYGGLAARGHRVHVLCDAAAPEREEQFAVVAQVSGVARALGSAEEFLQSSITRSALPGVRPLRSSMSA